MEDKLESYLPPPLFSSWHLTLGPLGIKDTKRLHFLVLKLLSFSQVLSFLKMLSNPFLTSLSVLSAFLHQLCRHWKLHSSLTPLQELAVPSFCRIKGRKPWWLLPQSEYFSNLTLPFVKKLLLPPAIGNYFRSPHPPSSSLHNPCIFS